jgi:predicted cytidylate kinase
MIITISGTPGSGKSSVGKELAKKLGYQFFSGGDMRGKYAVEKGLTIDELNKLGEEDPSTDKDIDEQIKEMGEKEDNFIMDSRTAWHFIPKSFKIYLTVDEKTGSERIFQHQQEKGARPDEKKYESPEEVLEETKARQESDKKRYQKWYGFDHTKTENYDLVVDTTTSNVNKIVEEILSKL